MTLRCIFSHSGAAPELGQEAIAVSQGQDAQAVLKRHSAALVPMEQCRLKARKKNHVRGAGLDLIPTKSPRSSVVELRRSSDPPPLAAFVYSHWPTGPD
jgi:hypothetical protein